MSAQDYDGPILEIENLSISFFTRLREIPAVMDFSCTVQPGEALGLVGESGCGKSTGVNSESSVGSSSASGSGSRPSVDVSVVVPPNGPVPSADAKLSILVTSPGVTVKLI